MVRRENLVLKVGYGLGLKKRGLGVAKKRGIRISLPALRRGVGQGISRSSKKFGPAHPRENAKHVLQECINLDGGCTMVRSICY